ncbi:MAG: hypothetical protein ABJA20_01670 [Novosphingobium sp.]
MEVPVGPLSDADEMFCHQTQEMFANVGTSDPAWTERAYGCAIAKDDRFALHWGIGKYTNRNVMDGFAGISVGRRQRNVRFSRRLAPDTSSLSVGPFHYQVIEPLRTTRVVLEETSQQPISFDITQRVIARPWIEDRSTVVRGYRRVQDEVRYVLCAEASGWIAFEGDRFDIDGAEAFGFRDHSWGIKQNTGAASPEVPDRASMPPGTQYRMVWAPCVLQRADGSSYRVHLFSWEVRSARGSQIVNESKIFGDADDSIHAQQTIFDLHFDPYNREPIGGRIILVMADGSTRPFEIEIACQSRVCLGAGLYHGYEGHYHGEARGRLNVEGAMIDSTADPATCRSIHQLRDILVRIRDVATGADGWGILNTEIVGAWPDLGLADANWR